MCWTPDPWQIRDEKSHLSQGSVLVSDHGYVWAKLVFYNFHSGYGKIPADTLVNRTVPDHHKS